MPSKLLLLIIACGITQGQFSHSFSYSRGSCMADALSSFQSKDSHSKTDSCDEDDDTNNANTLNSTLLISTSALRELLDSNVPVTLIDASYNIPGIEGDVIGEHFLKRIPGAKLFEADVIANRSTGYPHMMPSEEIFRMYMKKLRIKNNDHLIVVYDRIGMITSPRVWFTFKVFGKVNVKVLDGGLPKWLAEDHPIESGKYQIYQNEDNENDEDYIYHLDKSKVLSLEEVQEISKEIVEKKNPNWQILDARTADRHRGIAPEPRIGLRSGKIPGSINTFFMKLFRENRTLKSLKQLRKIYEESGVSFENNVGVVNYCGSGMTACINIFALAVLGKDNAYLYDGSWLEWGEVIKI